ncbi:MAG: hypothetical protein ACOY0T_21590 [Myxococcota bacterium]
MRNVKALLLGTLCVACGSESAYLGTSPEVLWWTDHETGDLSDWESPGGKTWTAGDGSVAVVEAPARSGSHVLRAMSTSADPNQPAAAIGIREGLMPAETCFSAWYYLPQLVVPSNVWLFFKFRSRSRVTDSNTHVDTWDINVANEAASWSLGLYNHDTGVQIVSKEAKLPAARWFQLEACLRASSGIDGRLRVWLEGQLIFDVQRQPTAPSPWVEWNVGSIAGGISPATATVYADDAAISTRRLGPDYPIFWRKP